MIITRARSIVLSASAHTGLMVFASAATTVFDDFSTGAYPPSAGLNSVAILTPFADNRLSYGAGADWSSSVDVLAGNLTYTLNTRVDPGPNYWFAMIYTSELGNMNLAGYDAFVIHVESLSGIGQILAHLGTGQPGTSVIPVNLAGTGDVVIPFANLGATDPSHPTAISFEILPGNRDFSVMISGISVVPEPSAAVLAGFGIAILAARRRR